MLTVCAWSCTALVCLRTVMLIRRDCCLCQRRMVIINAAAFANGLTELECHLLT